MSIGSLNKKFGWIWLLIAPLMGLFISSQFARIGYASITNEVTIAGETITLYMGDSIPRLSNRLLHAHGGLLAILNIVYGLSIDDVPLKDKTKRLGSILAVSGAVFVTFSFLFIQVPYLSSIGLPLRVLGGISIVTAILILVIGEFKK